MPQFRCSVCGKRFGPTDDYVCLNQDEVICPSHASKRGRKLVHSTSNGLKPFISPPIVVKSVAREWRDPSWLAPLEPFGGYRQT